MSEEIVDRAAEAAAPPPAPEIPAAPEVPAAPTQYQAPTAPPVTAPRERRGGTGFGVLLVLVGLGLLANQFVPGIDLWRYWPVAIIVLGVVSVIRGLMD